MPRTKTENSVNTVTPSVKTEKVEQINEVIENEIVTTDVDNKVEKKQKKFDSDEPVMCTSITAGELGMIGLKSNINYSWAGRGDTTEVEYQDLVAAIRSGKKHIFEPLFVIDDEEFLKQFPQVEKVYASMYSIKDLKDVLRLDASSMKKTILSLPNGAKAAIKNIASSMISEGALDSVKKIKTLDEIYDTKFMLMTELYK